MEQIRPVKFIKENVPAPAKILDLAAGDFAVVKRLREFGYEAEGVDLNMGVDLNNPYLSPNAPHDVVISCFVLHFLNNKANLIKSAYNNLKDDGLFFFQDIEVDENAKVGYLSEEEAEELIEANSFEIINKNKGDFFDKKPGHMHWHRVITIQARKR